MHLVLNHAISVWRQPALAELTNGDTHTEEGHVFQNWNASFYQSMMGPMLAVTLVLAWLARPSTSEVIPKGFNRFQWNYLSVWSLCIAADWLQGPYVYAIYAEYGFSQTEIATLFVVGFASSMVFGSVVGVITDRCGRKRCALLYCVLYILSCMTKHVNNYWALIFGRFTGGLATSLLFSCFECWMVSEHTTRHNFSPGLLSYMFGMMYTTMYLVAIVSGIVAGSIAEGFKLTPLWQGSILHMGGDCGPFDLAILCLIAGAVLIMFTWEENYSNDREERTESTGWTQLKDVVDLFRRDARVPLLGVVIACFEGAMYIFIFNWSPALKNDVVPPPYGLIFALFMMACMCGASVHTAMAEVMRPTLRLCTVFLLGVSSLMLASKYITDTIVLGALVQSHHIMAVFMAFLLFEFAIGVYFPSVGILKSEVVPEHVRSTVYNIYRVPLNAVVVGALLSHISLVTTYVACAALLGVALVASGAMLALDAPSLEGSTRAKMAASKGP